MRRFIKKNAHIRGKRWKKGEKRNFFTVLGRKNMIFEKKWQGGKNINYFDDIHPCQ